MTDGLHREDGKLIYYKHGKPYHAGAVEIDGNIYYIGKHGVAATGSHIVHGEMTNGILKRGTYTFGEDGILIDGSFVPARKHSKKHKLARLLGLPRRRASAAKKRLSKKGRRRLAAMLACVGVLLASLLVIGIVESRHTPPTETQDPSASRLTLPDFPREVALCSAAAKQCYDGTLDITEAVESGNPYRPFVFEYDLNGQSGVLRLSESEDLSDTRSWELAAASTSLSIDNLKTATTYYYAVDVNEDTYTGSFRTAAAPRFVSVPGIYNTRDIGGYTTSDGATVKQGLLIRGTELDGLVQPNYYLEASAEDAVRDTFGFRFDMDLRQETVFSGNYRSRLGDNVEHAFFNAVSYGTVFNKEYAPTLRRQFAALADASHYPMYLHCTYGADRTGTLVFLLQGVLGMSDEDMLAEYRLTGYYDPQYATLTYIEPLVNGLQSYRGDTLAEKTEDFLLNGVGVPAEDLASIRSIFLEP